MAVVSGRTITQGATRRDADVSQREDLANFISMITRDETPFMSSIGKTKATAIYHEWATDTIQGPSESFESVLGNYPEWMPPDKLLSTTGLSATGDLMVVPNSVVG